MFFKNVTCLTKVTDNQTKTTRTDECIYFNDSTVELKGKDISLDIKDREVVFIASSVHFVSQMQLASSFSSSICSV